MVVAVHAHPDDETLATGVALAHTVARGGSAHVITCTLGEEGEVIPSELAHLEGTPGLAEHRHGELLEAMATLGVGHSYLGDRSDPSRDRTPQGRPRWRDSGMAGSPSAQHPEAFVRADRDEAAALLAQRLRALRPDVVLTYDPTGGYQHPDHITTHEVTLAAWQRLPEAERGTLFFALTPRSWAEQDRAWLAEHVPSDAGLTLLGHEAPYASSVVADDEVTHEVVVPEVNDDAVRDEAVRDDAVTDDAVLAARDAALRAHRTQVSVFDGYYALSNTIAARLPWREGYRRHQEPAGPFAGEG